MCEIVDGVPARGGGDVDRMAVELFDTLCGLGADEVVAFHRECGRQHRRMFVHPLWCAGDFAIGPLGDDLFADLRTHLLFRGLEVVDEVLADPDALAGYLPAPPRRRPRPGAVRGGAAPAGPLAASADTVGLPAARWLLSRRGPGVPRGGHATRWGCCGRWDV